MENLRLRQDRESERLLKKKKKKGSERRETLPLPTPWVKLPKREVRAWNLAATHAVTPPPHESGKTHTIPTPTTRHPHGHTHHATPTSASAFTLKYLIYPLKSQNLCFLCLVFLFMRNLSLCYYYFFLALWLSYWWVCACLCELWLCATMQLYYIDKSESRVSRY